MAVSNSWLTISIPTYNRNDKLRRSVELLLPQLKEGIRLQIFDNGSSIPVEDTLKDILDSNNQIIVFRNKQNLGVSANILKCFEHCETRWMWLLGDDDPPATDAIETIVCTVSNYSDYGFINFKSHMSERRNSALAACGINDFISNIDDFGNILMISLGLYNIEVLQGDLRLGYQLGYCLAPHLVYLLSGIREETKVLFSDKPIINFAIHAGNTADGTWSWISVSLCISMLYEVPLEISANNKKKLASHIRTHIKPPNAVFKILEQERYAALTVYDKRFLLRQIFFRSLLFNSFSIRILDFIWSDFKLLFKSVFSKDEIKLIIPRDQRI